MMFAKALLLLVQSFVLCASAPTTSETLGRWCCTSTTELDKCNGLVNTGEFNFDCVYGTSVPHCMEMILNDNEADFITLDGGDIYKYKDEVKVIAAEDFGDGDASYYAVAVVKNDNPNAPKNLRDLNDKRSCHTGIGKTSGWITPMGTLSRMGFNPYNLFASSCVPGARLPQYADLLHGSNADKWCENCHGDGNAVVSAREHVCVRNKDEIYYGYTGALKCLRDGDGDVAFVNHKTIDQTDYSKNNFKLLCLESAENNTAHPDEYFACNLAKVPSHAVVMSKTKNDELGNEVLEALKNAIKEIEKIAPGKFLGGQNALWKSSILDFVKPEDKTPLTYLGKNYACNYAIVHGQSSPYDDC